jgi:hypothetical protein
MEEMAFQQAPIEEITEISCETEAAIPWLPPMVLWYGLMAGHA